jgi:cobalt/nickel transport protein
MKMKLWQKNLLLLLLVVIITVIPLIFVGGEYGGADGAAEGLITEINEDYVPWASSPFEPPSGEIESLLFALQAAIGAAVIGFGFGRLSAKNKADVKS